MHASCLSESKYLTKSKKCPNRPLSRRLDRCDRVIQNESRDPFGGNVYYVTIQITFLTRKFRNRERNLHCDVVHMTPKWVFRLTLDCNGVFAIKAYGPQSPLQLSPRKLQAGRQTRAHCHCSMKRNDALQSKRGASQCNKRRHVPL